jgi:hypothetical protein
MELSILRLPTWLVCVLTVAVVTVACTATEADRPSCDALGACCAAMPATVRDTCESSYKKALESGATDADCKRVLSSYPREACGSAPERSGSSGAPNAQATPNCEALLGCCSDLGWPSATATCIDQVTRLKSSPSGDADCKAALAAYKESGACVSEASERSCKDGIDNDGDGFIDCKDKGCESTTACLGRLENSKAACSDGQDNDSDGFIDCNDRDCQRNFCSENCTDGVDNDGDGYLDCRDSECSVEPACAKTEDNNATCSDGRDNDGDGYIDCNDFGCSRNPTVTVCAK